MITVLLLLSFLTLLYYLIVKPRNYWSNKHIKAGKAVPIFGDAFNMILGKESFAEMVKRTYNEFPDARYYGLNQFMVPTIVMRSPDLIKQTCVKDFDHFLNHRTFIPDNVDELWSKNLFALRGQTWKNMRSTLSPSFTSSKMKLIFILICQNAKTFADYFLKEEKEIVEIECKDIFGRYTTDVIASAAFGIQVNSLAEKENEFYLMGKQASNFNSIYAKTVSSLYQIVPSITAFFKIPLFRQNVKEFFVDLVKNTINMREKENIKRPDMLGLLIEARKNKEANEQENKNKESHEGFAVVEEHLNMKKNYHLFLTDSDIASQAFVFFVAGFDTVSSAMCFMAQELAANPDIQKKLIQEIDENRSDNGDPSYETILKMTYLDMVVCETLRLWPIGVAVDRVVTKPYVIQPELPEEKPIQLKVDDVLLIPIIGIHHDPNYYEDPTKFDPERFSVENRKKIDPYTYLPFGVGPRNCIGSRFALLEIKAVFFYLLSHFEIVPIEKTQIPLQMSKKTFNLTPVNGFHLGLKKRY